MDAPFPLSDSYGRVARDLRVSLTDRCNLRCTYCMPAEGLDWLADERILTDDEVKHALEELPENFRLPVLLADVDGFAYKEIAEMLDIPIGTVMSRLHRGRKAMQKSLYEFAHARGLATAEIADEPH